jgi:predicted nuclease of restriction endonuclease-like (RecB) superfamily
MLILYFFIGKYVSKNTRNKNWGTGAIDMISNLLQQELNGLRGFSATNIKNMRIFYEEWHCIESFFYKNSTVFFFEQPIFSKKSNTINVKNKSNRQLVTDDLENSINQIQTEQLENVFFQIGFTNHISILNKCKTIKKRIFYIEKCKLESWNNQTLQHHLKNKLDERVGKLKNNFEVTIQKNNFKDKALLAFKDELLLDFINIADADDEINERVLEQAIVLNIKKFIMALGSDFSFIGNQYRLLIEEEEFFVDLLFYNRKIQSLIAIELKKGKFKAEYAGKMNLYLSALDEYIKQPHENPSIGIILCKEKSNKIVEFAFRDTTKPMGVITYKTYNDLPENYKNILPNTDDLKKLM